VIVAEDVLEHLEAGKPVLNAAQRRSDGIFYLVLVRSYLPSTRVYQSINTPETTYDKEDSQGSYRGSGVGAPEAFNCIQHGLEVIQEIFRPLGEALVFSGPKVPAGSVPVFKFVLALLAETGPELGEPLVSCASHRFGLVLGQLFLHQP